MKDFQSNYFRYWQWFVLNHYDELFEVIMAMMKDRIEELLPQLIENYMREYVNNLSVNVETKLNGKSIDLSGLKDDIQNIIYQSLRK